MLVRTLLALPLLLSISIPRLAGEPSIQRFFPEFSGYRFLMLEEVNSLEDDAGIGPIPQKILEEALFQSYSRWRVTRSPSDDYELGVFEFADSSGSFQLLSLWPRFNGQIQWTRLDLPAGNKWGPGEGVFWRGNYLFNVTASSGRRLTGEAFSDIVRVFCQRIRLENLYPVTVSHLPREGLVPTSVEFYLGADSLKLNDQFPEPLLKEIGFVDQIEIVYGLYEGEESSLFLIGYPTPALADDYFLGLQEGLREFFSAKGVYMKRAGVIIALLVGSEDSAQRILQQVEYAPSVQWLYEKESDSYTGEVLTFLGLLTKTIFGTGTFIIMIVSAGLVMGLIRYAILRRFPRIRKRRDMVRLSLDQESSKHNLPNP